MNNPPPPGGELNSHQEEIRRLREDVECLREQRNAVPQILARAVPFSAEVLTAVLPQHLKFPNVGKYDGTCDPEEQDILTSLPLSHALHHKHLVAKKITNPVPQLIPSDLHRFSCRGLPFATGKEQGIFCGIVQKDFTGESSLHSLSTKIAEDG